jgi:hypothetical protein
MIYPKYVIILLLVKFAIGIFDIRIPNHFYHSIIIFIDQIATGYFYIKNYPDIKPTFVSQFPYMDVI